MSIPAWFAEIIYYNPKFLTLKNDPLVLKQKNALVSYYEAGVPVKDVLQFGTLNGTIAIGKQNEIGVIKAGAFADIIAFDGDLENNFKELIYEKLSFVMKGGIIFKNK